MGAVAAALKGKDLLTGTRLLGMKLDRQQLQVGPVTNIQLLYILLDRALLYYSHVINWAHGRRDYPEGAIREESKETGKKGYTSGWNRDERKICERLFNGLQKEDPQLQEQAAEDLVDLLKKKLQQISEGISEPGNAREAGNP
jgi:hypothetical protein